MEKTFRFHWSVQFSWLQTNFNVIFVPIIVAFTKFLWLSHAFLKICKHLQHLQARIKLSIHYKNDVVENFFNAQNDL